MCEFIVTAPNHYQVISNGLKVEETNLSNGKRLTHWKQSVPIASWLFVLGAADFAVQYVDTFDGKSIETWVYRQDRDDGFYDFAEPTKKVLEFYSNYIGPFSYEKLANIQSNSVGGGMEAASAIFYGDKSVTGNRSIRWRNVVIHEIAHQWFGNAVNEYDWDDVWLSEGFATYFTLLFIEHAYGRDVFL
jgi:aminopeptidase N